MRIVIDLNIHRVIESSIIEYSSLIKPECHPQEAVKYILQERLINLNSDHWEPSYGNSLSKINILSETVYNIYSSKAENAIDHFLKRLYSKEVFLTQDENKLFNTLFNASELSREQHEQIQKIFEEDEENIKEGIEKQSDEREDEGVEEKKEEREEDTEEEKKFNYMDILIHIIPLICLLTIHTEESSFTEMYNLIENNEYYLTILLDQTRSWWGKNIDSRTIKKFVSVYMRMTRDDRMMTQTIRTVKELFRKNIRNSKELSKLIDKYFIPQELEKKTNAEVSTPYKLRQEMLNKMLKTFGVVVLITIVKTSFFQKFLNRVVVKEAFLSISLID